MISYSGIRVTSACFISAVEAFGDKHVLQIMVFSTRLRHGTNHPRHDFHFQRVAAVVVRAVTFQHLYQTVHAPQYHCGGA